MTLYQVNRTLYKQHFLRQFVRGIHKHTAAKVLYPLESRTLLKVSGNEATVFLQGLITNDMRHFEEGHNSMYAMFLNNKGRVLYDTLIHKWQDKDAFMLECDKNVLILLQKHLRIYKLKRKVEIADASKDFNLWALISPSETILESQGDNKINIYKDPRLVDLGSRILSAASVTKDEIQETVGKDTLIENSEEGYKYLRYKLGVSEGAEDLPLGSSFPLEANCDYLHGVSFHKGCYIGQELTARVHHTGVVRKRIMPLKFSEEIKDNLEKDSVISASDNPKSNVGKLKSYLNDYGLGLVRIKEGLEAKSLVIGKYSVEVVKPTWWPMEAPKEKATIIKD